MRRRHFCLPLLLLMACGRVESVTADSDSSAAPDSDSSAVPDADAAPSCSDPPCWTLIAAPETPGILTLTTPYDPLDAIVPSRSEFLLVTRDRLRRSTDLGGWTDIDAELPLGEYFHNSDGTRSPSPSAKSGGFLIGRKIVVEGSAVRTNFVHRAAPAGTFAPLLAGGSGKLSETPAGVLFDTWDYAVSRSPSYAGPWTTIATSYPFEGTLSPPSIAGSRVLFRKLGLSKDDGATFTKSGFAGQLLTDSGQCRVVGERGIETRADDGEWTIALSRAMFATDRIVVSGNRVFAIASAGGDTSRLARSIDGCKTFSVLPGTYPLAPTTPLVLAGSKQVLFCKQHSTACRRSDDDGESFVDLTLPSARGATSFATAPTGSTMFAYADGVRRSTDAGRSWTALTTPLPAPRDILNPWVAIDPKSGALFVGSNLSSVYRSTDDGASFVALPVTGQLFFGGGKILSLDARVSSDGGTTWTGGMSVVAPREAGIAASGKMFVHHDKGTDISNDGTTWSRIPTPPGAFYTDSYNLQIGPDETLYADVRGTEHLLLRSPDWGTTWTTVTRLTSPSSVTVLPIGAQGVVVVARGVVTLDGSERMEVSISTNRGDSFGVVTANLPHLPTAFGVRSGRIVANVPERGLYELRTPI